MKRIFNITLILTLLSPVIVQAQEKMQVAVLDFKTRAISSNLGQIISDLMRAEMVKTGYFIVVERSQIATILKEQGFQKTGCTDNECVVELGKLLSAKKILVGEVSKLGSSILITVRIVDVEKGIAEFAETEKAENEDSVDTVCKKLTNKLTENIVNNNRNGFKVSSEKRNSVNKSLEIYEDAKKSQALGCCLTAVIPGGQHFYAGNIGIGAFYLFSSIASYGMSIYSASSASEQNNNAKISGYYIGLYCLIRIVDIIHGYNAIEDYNSQLIKKLDSFSGSDNTKLDFDIVFNPDINDNQCRLSLSMKF